jgi:hypothetical protein
MLRGYSWVTVCPEELAARLGGARALADTGAFFRIEELPGGVRLQATEEFAAYDHAATERAFSALAPVLPPGTPYRSPFHEGPWRLVDKDAAELRPR